MIKFSVGKKYMMRSICDSNCKWEYVVVSRTAKTIILNDGTKCRIKVMDDCELCKPLGSYSMAPVLRASREVE